MSGRLHEVRRPGMIEMQRGLLFKRADEAGPDDWVWLAHDEEVALARSLHIPIGFCSQSFYSYYFVRRRDYGPIHAAIACVGGFTPLFRRPAFAADHPDICASMLKPEP